MSSRASGSAVLLAAALLVGGCRKEEAAPEPPEDRTLSKLRQEVDRVNQGGARAGPPSAVAPEAPNERLAGLAAGHDDGSANQRLPLPDKNDTVHVDTVAVKLTGLEAMHTVKGSGKLGLTTEDLFLRVQLITENVGPAPARLDLGTARVLDAEGKEHGIARDAQTVGGTRSLQRAWEAGERGELILFFEVPPQAVRSTLTLVLPASSGDIRVALR